MRARMLIKFGAIAIIATGCASVSEQTAGQASRSIGDSLLGVFGVSLDAEARTEASSAELRALELGAPGVPEKWTAPNGSAYGEFVAGYPYEARGLKCCDFTHTVYASGRPEVGRGTACRQPDGVWKRVG